MEFCVEEVKSDCVELLSRFQTSDSVRFQTFSKIWREMNFSEIFYGTVNHGEQRAFCRLILDTTSSFFMPPYSFQIRVGGLYLLYSLYHSQTSSPPEQIRLALKDWKDVKKFEKDAVDAQHHDVVYILRKLMFQKAFVFAAMPVALSFKKKRKLQRSVPCEQFMERPSRPQELINIDLLEELSNVEEIYGKLKTSVSSALEQSESSLNLVCKSLAPQLRSTVVDFYQWQQRRGVPRTDDGGGEGTSSQQERAAPLTHCLVCVLSAPIEPSSSPPSNQRPLEKPQRPPSRGAIVRWRWIPRVTRPDPPARRVILERRKCHSKPEPIRTYTSQVTRGMKARRRLASIVSARWTLVLKRKKKCTTNSTGDEDGSDVHLHPDAHDVLLLFLHFMKL
ncbi:snRNA-activating protein complex subunit 1b isoform X1 [Gasterosteus aculeatus]